MALMHYQFEAIHPFGDGIDGTGRLMILLYLVQARLLGMPVFCLRHKNRTEYYRFLLHVTSDQEWSSWIEYVLLAVAQTAEWTKSKVLEIRKLELERIERMKPSPKLKKI